MPDEPNASMISSIINLVCPQCGGHMRDFECCGRNWLSEWEWAVNDTKKQNPPRAKGTVPKR